MSRGRSGAMAVAALVVALGGCQGTTAPEPRDLLGSWTSAAFADATVRMTISESVRSVGGAGAWETSVVARPFQVSGALARDEVALYLDFPGESDMSFQGFFREADRLEGFLSGGGYLRSPIAFTRVDLNP